MLTMVAALAVGSAFPLDSLRDEGGHPPDLAAYKGRPVLATFGPDAAELAKAAGTSAPRVLVIGKGGYTAKEISQPRENLAALVNTKGRIVKLWTDPPSSKLAGYVTDWLSGTSLPIGYEAPDPRDVLSPVAPTLAPGSWLQAIANAVRIANPQAKIPRGKNGLLVAFLSTRGAVDELYYARLSTIAAECAKRDIDAWAIFSEFDETRERISRVAGDTKLGFTCAADAGHAFADAFRAMRTPEVFLLDAKRRVVYTGAIDSSTFGGDDHIPYLLKAITSLAEGKEISLKRTMPFGTGLRRDGETTAAGSRSNGRPQS